MYFLIVQALYYRYRPSYISHYFIEIKVIAKTKYSISVLYSSGYSTATGLTPKTSDSKGYVAWS
jgi:hypothetical protein